MKIETYYLILVKEGIGLWDINFYDDYVQFQKEDNELSKKYYSDNSISIHRGIHTRTIEQPKCDCEFSEVDYDKLITHLIDGLFIDGSHHKQWYLEEAIKMISGFDNLNDILEDDEWDYDKGIAP